MQDKAPLPLQQSDLHPSKCSVIVTFLATEFDRYPAMTFSLFGDKFTRHSGITLLMEDLNDGLRTPGAIMLGGGNPAQIPEMQDYFQTLLTDMLESGKATDAPAAPDSRQPADRLLDQGLQH